MSSAIAQADLTAAQGHLLLYLARQPEGQLPRLRDLEQALQLSHATISGLLARLEKKGFLTTLPDEADRRCRRVALLPKGRSAIAWADEVIAHVEERLLQGFSPKEREQFARFLTRAICNMGGSPCEPNCKEEKIGT